MKSKQVLDDRVKIPPLFFIFGAIDVINQFYVQLLEFAFILLVEHTLLLEQRHLGGKSVVRRAGLFQVGIERDSLDNGFGGVRGGLIDFAG